MARVSTSSLEEQLSFEEKKKFERLCEIATRDGKYHIRLCVRRGVLKIQWVNRETQNTQTFNAHDILHPEKQ